MRMPRLRLAVPAIFFLILTAFSSLAVAQQTWWVQSADYGSGNRRQDVTQTVRRLVGGPNFRVNNQTMGGDPYVGADKTLRIVGKDAQGNVKDFRYGEGAIVTTSMFRANQWGGGGGGWNGGNGQRTWFVQSADYGAGNRRQDVTQTVRRLVDGPNFRVNNQTLGTDPYVGADKTLRITGRNDQGMVREFKYGEGSTVDASMFRGRPWGGGGGGGGYDDNVNQLQIVSGQWGSGSRMVNVTQRLQGYVRNGRISIKVTPQNLGDPTPGVSKKLIVGYTYGGRLRTEQRMEGEMLNLP
jgi:hypothetical protein